MASKEVRQLIARLRAQGCEVRLARSGHYRVTRSGVTVTVPATPGRARSLANVRAGLRRHLGVEL